MNEQSQNTQLQKPVFELLAPAGSYETFLAVVAAGADAVYLAGKSFGARAYAGNFEEEELCRAIDYAHLFGRRVYLTVNTLLKNQELEDRLYGYLLPLYERGLDAVIVQDIGVFAFVRQAFPGLAIHASTQMTVTSAGGAAFLEGLGARRIVLARELSLAEIRQIHEGTGAQLEVFVHGALCYSYSGQCLFSSMLGGRSGNRGRCAQPCRLPYEVDGKHSYVLSLRDLCGLGELPGLHQAGVCSLKIEGRMKQLSYAAGVVSCYRKYIDRFQEALSGGEETKVQPLEEDRRALAALGSRCGFTDGYFHRKNGPDMVTFQSPSFERGNEALQEKNAERALPRLAADGRLTLRAGERARYEVTCGGCSFYAGGAEVMRAQTKPLLAEDVRRRMSKTGESVFAMRELAVDMDGDVFLPNGVLNRLRREALDGLQHAMLSGAQRDGAAASMPLPGQIPAEWESGRCSGKPKPRVICLTENRGLLDVILEQSFVTTVYLEAAAYERKEELAEDIGRCKWAGKEAGIALPRIFRQHTTTRYEGFLAFLQELSADIVLVRSYDALAFAEKYLKGSAIVADSNLYSMNNRAVRALTALGAARNTVPQELNAGEIAHRDNRNSEMVVYGHCPLMTSVQCVRANTKGCSHRPSVTYLKDRTHRSFPVKSFCGDCYNVIYNSLPTMLFARLGEIRRMGITGVRLDFTVEDEEQAGNILALFGEYNRGIDAGTPQWQERCTGGHYRRGVE